MVLSGHMTSAGEGNLVSEFKFLDMTHMHWVD